MVMVRHRGTPNHPSHQNKKGNWNNHGELGIAFFKKLPYTTLPYPICSMVLEYLALITSSFWGWMLVNIPYMEHHGAGIGEYKWICFKLGTEHVSEWINTWRYPFSFERINIERKNGGTIVEITLHLPYFLVVHPRNCVCRLVRPSDISGVNLLLHTYPTYHWGQLRNKHVSCVFPTT